MRRILAVAVLAIGNSAQFERDMKSIREVLRKRSKKIAAAKLGSQARLSMNFQARSAHCAEPSQLLADCAEELSKARAEDSARHAATKRKERSDKGHPRCKLARVSLLPHCTDADLGDLRGVLQRATDGLVAGAPGPAPGVDDAEVEGPRADADLLLSA